MGPEFPVFDAHKELFLRISPASRRMADGVISNPLRDALQQHKWLARCFLFLPAFNSSAGPEGSAERTTQTWFRTVGMDGPVLICKLFKETTLGHDSVWQRADSLIRSGITIAELLSPERLSDGRAFEREWTALREYVSPWSDKEQLQQYLTAVDWTRLLLLAEAHGVLGQLAAGPSDRHVSAIPPEIN